MEFVNEIIENIWKDRYRKNEETLDGNLHRVAKFCSTNESEEKEFYDVMNKGLFYPGGRTMSNSGIGSKLTLNNCFVAGTKVLTKRGYINIEQVKVGDYVLTDNNTWQKINETMCRDYEGDLFKITAHGLYNDIICTPNHQLLTKRGWIRADRLLFDSKYVHAVDKLKLPTLTWDKQYEKIDLTNYFVETDKKRIRYSDDGKICIEHLCGVNRYNDKVVWNKQTHYINRFLELTPEFRYFIGRWIGDGSITRYKGKRNPSILQIVFNASKEKDAAELCRKIGDKIFGFECTYTETKQNVIALRWSNEILATFFLKEFGEKCDGKFLSDKYVGDIKIAEGLMDADGFINTHGGGHIVLKNKKLINWMRETLFLNGYNTSPIKKNTKYNDTYELYYSPNIGNRGFNQSLIKDFYDKRNNLITKDDDVLNYIVLGNVEIIQNQKCKVYNLSVENIHSYVVNGIFAHNCFVAPQVQDSYDDIYDKVKLGAITHQRGGGIGYDFSQLRPKGSPTSNGAIASGAVSFMDVFNAQTETTIQGQRRGANMGVMNVYDMDIETFINAKASDAAKLNHFNLSVMVDDDFIEAVKNDKEIYLHHPVYNSEGKVEKDSSKWMYSKKISAKYLWDEIIKKAYDNGEPGIFFYDNLNKDNNLWYIENIVCSNPCAEYLAGTVYGNNPLTGEKLKSEEFGGACNLGSLFLHNFVCEPFTINAHINWDLLRDTTKTAVKMLDNIIDINKFPSEIYENYQKNFRTIGLGFTGLADTLAMLNLKYDSQKARDYVDNLVEFIAFNAYKASVELAEQKGAFPFLNREKFCQSGYILKHCKERDSSWRDLKEDIMRYGIRNARLLSVAPVGTLSLTFGNNCSSGLEPIFSLDYERRVKIGGQTDDKIKIVHMQDYAYGQWLKVKNDKDTVVKEDVFITALEMDVNSHVNMLGVIAKHIDMSCSKTINVPENYSFEDTKNIYMKCHDLGIKGCTIFRPNPIRQGVMITNKEENENKASVKELGRGYVYSVCDDLISYKRTIKTGCGKMYLHLDFDEATGEPFETWIDLGGSGGCERNLTFISRLISLALRGGIPLNEIIEQSKSIKPCIAYVNRTNKHGDTSPGTSCPSALGIALKELNEKIQNKCFDDEVDDLDIIEPAKIFKTNNNTKVTCPECGADLVFEGGCNVCKECGYSKCG